MCPVCRMLAGFIIRWLLAVVFRAVVFKLLVWCGAEGYVSGLQDACWFYYTVVAACGISCCGFQVAGLVRS